MTAANAAGNADQIAYWNAEVGERWAAQQARLDALIAPFGAAALTLAAPQPGERALDIGCGCGDTTFALADAVGPEGRVLGVDVSAPMLARAKERMKARMAELAGAHGAVSFLEADAATAPLPTGHDLLYSRFGVMFFADPVGAFAAMRRALKPGARVAFACWRTVAENPWMVLPMAAGVQALGRSPPPSDPHAPGPFAFADDARVRAILEAAGYERVALTPFDVAMTLGGDAMAAARLSMEVGPLGGLVREAGESAAPVLLAAVAAALAPYEKPDGVRLMGGVWLVTARAP
ncbi:MAG: methyltransferase domain-containing protein [Hyphomonadaceae bacterium]|nr:methyltransferase domain-containing protein [Hyphomonadaceae bacterium]